ncbi:hypothetical protein ACFRJ3_36320 [Streptomyces sp. NPDC056696]|uniref:hypothetical protein n=1 Tax=Streptomyces sp. NPDC056696 TaxID=3345914 RepID=UPI0036C24623
MAVLVLPVLGAPEEVFQEYGPRRRRRDVFGEQGSGREFSVQGLHDRGLLMFGRRGEPLDEVIERFTQSSGRAWGLAGNLSRAHFAVDSFAYKVAPGEQEPAGTAVTVCSAWCDRLGTE